MPQTYENSSPLTPTKLTLATVPTEDPVVYDMICAADTIGVFQIESRAQMSMLPRLKPRKFYDLVIEVAIVRPGPIQGGMVHPYLRRRSGNETVTYPHPIVEEVLSKTLGVPLFQEQVMRLAIVAAGFTPGEADQLRRAMGAWKKRGTIEKFRAKFHAGLMARGFPPEFADQIYAQIAGFGEYGFPESHAASFALLAYVSAWLKCHYPAEFAAAIINSQPMGFYGPAQLIQDARAHGVEVLPVDVNLSEWDCTLEAFLPSPSAVYTQGECKKEIGGGRGENAPLTPGPSPPGHLVIDATSPCRPGGEGRKAVRLGFRLIRGFPEAHAIAMTEARRAAPFRSITDVRRRGGVSKAQLARLAAADAFRSLGLDRRAALWQILALGEELPLFAELEEETPPPPLPELSIGQHVIADYQTIGLSLKAHPIELIRPDLDRMKVVTAKGLNDAADKNTVRVAGLVTIRQRPPTANGTVFMSLEDETGFINLIIWNRTWERFRKVAKDAVALYVEGKVEKAEGVTHVCPTKIEDLSSALAGLDSRSRDFR